MTFRNRYALGISTGLGLILAQSWPANSYSAYSANPYPPNPYAASNPYAVNGEQPAVRHHFQRTSDRHHESRQRRAAAAKAESAKAGKDAKALSSLKNDMRDLRRQVVEVETLRRELTDLKERIWGPTPLSLSLAVLPRPQSSAVVEPKRVTLKLPDLGQPYRPQAPVNPATASAPAVIEERAVEGIRPRSAVEEAKAYLIDTATPGYTMVRQGVPVAIGRLHPEFVVKLASAVQLARQAGMTHAGVFSAYRPPAFGIGGFGDKFNSLHSYGLAADMTGIGGPGSRFARLWQDIVRRVGLYLPYGANNRAEFNHTQLVPTKVAPSFLRHTITASQPKDLHAMWLASGISSLVADVTAANSLATNSLATKPASLASVAGPADGDKQAPAPQQPARVAAPRVVRARSGRKRGAPARGRAAEGQRSPRRRTGKSTRNLDWMRRVLSPF